MDLIAHCKSPKATSTGIPFGIENQSHLRFPALEPASLTCGNRLTGKSAFFSLKLYEITN